jgi:hypothetical protein
MIDPVTAVTLGKAISDATGLTDWIAGKFGESAPVARKVIDIATSVTGAKNPQDVVDILTRDSAKAAEVAQAVRDQEMELINLAYQDLKDARGMYQKTGHEQADKIAAHVITWNAPLVGVLLTLYGISLVYVKDANTAQAVGTLLGGSIAALWQERQAVMGFFFGSSLGSKLKDTR